MATITKSYAEQLADLKTLEALGQMPAYAQQVSDAEALRLSENRPFATLDGRYVLLATDTERDAAVAATAAEAATNALESHPNTLEANCVAALNGSAAKIDIRKLIIAKAVSDEAYRLAKAPGALTGGELSALRARIANIYKAI